MKLAIIGDFNPDSRTHTATGNAIAHSKAALHAQLDKAWVATDSITQNFAAIANTYMAFWIAPGSPYKSMTAVLEIVKFALVFAHTRKFN